MRNLCRTLACLTLAFFGGLATLAFAARPMITDDARVTDANGCQIETWLRVEPAAPRATEFWALPACNPLGNLEMTLGGATRRIDGLSRQSTIQAQLKTILLPLTTDGFGMGLAAGVLSKRAPDAAANLSDNSYVYVPMSQAFFNDRLVLHVNVGASYDRNEKKTLRTWGIGSETALTSRVYLIAETFGETGSAPYRHGGFRFWLIPNRLQLDTTVGMRAGDRDSRWASIGMRVLFPPE